MSVGPSGSPMGLQFSFVSTFFLLHGGKSMGFMLSLRLSQGAQTTRCLASTGSNSGALWCQAGCRARMQGWVQGWCQAGCWFWMQGKVLG